MLTNSFCFLPGIGKKKEILLWKSSILSWEQFLQKESINGISKERKVECDNLIKIMKKHLAEGDSYYFALNFPQSEVWRLYPYFRDEALFLDIETNGKGEPIVIGMYDGQNTMVMINGYNMEKQLLVSALYNKKLLITYNGKSYDMPRIIAYFRLSQPEILHIDLKSVCNKLNLKGGLKKIEEQLGIKRPKHLYGSPIGLWRAFHASGDREYLDLLIKYNEEDVINLHPLMERIYAKLQEAWGTSYK